jgi:hypothetical protein
MIIEQTVEIPVNHRLLIDVPPEMPAGRTKVRFDPLLGIDFSPETWSSSPAAGRKAAAKPQEKLAAKPFDPEKAAAARKALCGMGQSDGHNVDRFLAWKQADREHEWEIEQQQQEERRLWKKR